MNEFRVKRIQCDVLIHRSGMEPASVHVTNARVLLAWHLKRAAYLAELEAGMTAEELKLYEQLTTMITERVAREIER